MTSSYETIFFDIDGTLFNYEMSAFSALAATLKEVEIRSELETIYSVYKNINTTLWEKMELGEIDSKSLRVMRFKLLFDQFGVKDHDSVAASRLYLKHLSGKADLIPSAREILTRLHPHYQLGLITNGIASVQRNRLHVSGLEHFFSHVFISEECGISKPDPGIFDMAVKACETDRDRILYIGDSISSDMIGASNAGIDFCWFNPAALAAPASSRYRFEITALSDLCAFV
jgi:2-haloacid dehalogenase